MGEKKKNKSFTEQNLKDMGLVEIKPNMFIKGTSPLLQKDEQPSQVGKLAAKIKSESEGAAPIMARNGKYGVSHKSKRTYNGKVYHSTLEMNYRQHLDLLAKAGEVIYIEEQVPYELLVSGKKICTYVLDFRVTYKDGSKAWIDTKGHKTAIYEIKKKLFEAIFNPIKIKEVYAGDF